MEIADYSNPLSLNAYAYTNGDPMNSYDPFGLSAITVPPVVPGLNCSSAFIDYATEFGATVQQLFDSDLGILGIMSYLEQQGTGTIADQLVWAAMDWTFLNRWDLSQSQKLQFYGSIANVPATFEATVTTGSTRSQVFTTDGTLLPGFQTVLINALTGSPSSSACQGVVSAFEVGQGVLLAHNSASIQGLPAPIRDPVPGSLQFGSNGAVPSHSSAFIQAPVAQLVDRGNAWVFYSETLRPRAPIRTPLPPRRGGR